MSATTGKLLLIVACAFVSAGVRAQSQAPSKVLGLWQGMTIAEFTEAVKGAQLMQESKCADCLIITAPHNLPAAYRSFPGVAAYFYRQRLVGFFMNERVHAFGAGSEVVGEADKVAADLERAYGKPEITRKCTEAGFTYETIGQSWTAALMDGNIDWSDIWTFGSSVFGTTPSNDEADKAKLARISLDIGGIGDNTALIVLEFRFQDYEQYDSAAKHRQ